MQHAQIRGLFFYLHNVRCFANVFSVKTTYIADNGEKGEQKTMMRDEFNNMVRELGGRREATAEEYTVIEYVYTWHPAISETRGKKQVAELFNSLGISVFRDMTETAKKAEDLEEKISAARNYLEYLISEREALTK